MLRKYSGNVLDYVEPPIDDPLERDRLRVALVAALLHRGERELAQRTARDVTEQALRAEATGLLGGRL
jgi:hypothetical protein